jgi:hypothetical protein
MVHKWRLLAAFAMLHSSAATGEPFSRELTTDRPDITESPFTVEAGRWQFEGSIGEFARARRADAASPDATLSLMSTTIRYGLSSHAEIGVIVDAVGFARFSPPSSGARWRRGIGGFGVRGKLNLWGNDTVATPGDTAGAILATIYLPTDRDDGIGGETTEYTVIAPMMVELASSVSLSMNAGFRVARACPACEHDFATLASVSMAMPVTGALSGYVEMAVDAVNRDDAAVVAGAGLTLALSGDVQLDGGVNFGLSGDADRYAPFAGVSVRY